MKKVLVSVLSFSILLTACGYSTNSTNTVSTNSNQANLNKPQNTDESKQISAIDWMSKTDSEKLIIVQDEMKKINYNGNIKPKELTDQITNDFNLVPPRDFTIQMYVDKKIEDIEKKAQNELNAPLKVQDAYVKKNEIGTPEAYVILKNTSNKNVDAYKVEIKCYNSFGEPVNDPMGSNIFRGIEQQVNIAPGEQFGGNVSWMLAVQDTTTKITATVTEVHFNDGSKWSINDSN